MAPLGSLTSVAGPSSVPCRLPQRGFLRMQIAIFLCKRAFSADCGGQAQNIWELCESGYLAAMDEDPG